MGVVFKELKLAKYGDELFENPKFNAWVKYADKFNAKNKDPEKVASSIPTLTNKYGYAKVDEMIGKAKLSASPTTRNVAENVEDQLFNSWKGLEVDDVFQKLEHNNGLDGIFTNPLFLTFEKYLEKFYPNKPAMAVEALARNYGDVKVSKMLEVATNNLATSRMATRLQNDLIASWKDKKFNTEYVYTTILQLDSTPGNLFENPNYDVWARFVYKSSEGRTGSFDALWNILGEKTFAQKAVAARETGGSLDTIEAARGYLLKKLLSVKKDPKNVAELLGNSYQGKRLASVYKTDFEGK